MGNPARGNMLLGAAWASGAPMAPRADAALAPALDDAFAVVPAGLLRKLQLIHIPKTGGGTLEDVGFKHGVKWGKYREDWPGGNCPRGCPRTSRGYKTYAKPTQISREKKNTISNPGWVPDQIREIGSE